MTNTQRDESQRARLERLNALMSDLGNLMQHLGNSLANKGSDALSPEVVELLESGHFRDHGGCCLHGDPSTGKEADVESMQRLMHKIRKTREQGQESPELVGNGTRPWASRVWENAQQVALRFASREELDAAIDWLWATPELRDLPRVHLGENTMAVPAGAVELFRQKGYKFDTSSVVSAGELPPEEVARIRRER